MPATSEALKGILGEKSDYQESITLCSQEAEEWNRKLEEFIPQKRSLDMLRTYGTRSKQLWGEGKRTGKSGQK